MQVDLIFEQKDALGQMLLDYLAGDHRACVDVISSVLDMDRMAGSTMFRSLDRMADMERLGLDCCKGKVLDVGAGSGCHSLVLQDRGLDVTAMDISPGCVAVMAAQGVKTVRHDSLFSHKDTGYDTLLMLMNGMGICGTIEGLNYFFQHIQSLVAPGGQVIADSTDISQAFTCLPLAGNDPDAPYYGETRFSMSYKDVAGDPFDWLYIDFATLSFYAEFHGWRCQKIFGGKDGKYLARIY